MGKLEELCFGDDDENEFEEEEEHTVVVELGDHSCHLLLPFT
jgi:hypothetical protein